MSGSERQGRPRHPRVLIVALLLVAVGTVTLGLGVRAQHHAPQPMASAAAPGAGPTARATPEAGAPSPATPDTDQGPVLPASAPVTLDIASIGVDSSLQQLGLTKDKTVQVPPLTRHAPAGWLRTSPTPGQLGPAVILGHVDSKYGPGVFFRLGALKPGATVKITRVDDTVVVFRVDRVVSYPKDTFPTLAVYGNTDHAALRLITCGGDYDRAHHGYQNNIVAYASMVSSHEGSA